MENIPSDSFNWQQRYEQLYQECESIRYILSHPLHDPLRSVIQQCQKIREGTVPLSLETISEIEQHVSDVTERIRIVNQYAFLLLRAPKTPPEPVDLNKLITEVKKKIEALATSTHATLTTGPLPTVLGYTDLLFDLFFYLIDNGLQYKSESDPIIHIQAESDANGFKISVTDNGIGLMKLYERVIYRPLQRLDPNDGHQGAGMGLTFARQIVRIHGSDLSFTSEGEAGKGTCFFFTLPAA